MTALDLELGLQADELLRAAQEAGYRHPRGFTGFSAALRIHDGRTVAAGTVTIPEDGPPELAVAADGDALDWASHELASMAAHRRHRTYEDGDGRHPKRLGPDDGHALGRLVELDDPLASSFRVRDGHIAEITRSHGGSRFTIVIQDRAVAPDGRSISTAFTVSYWDGSTGRLSRTDIYADEHVVVDGLLLPSSRQVVRADDDGLLARRLELSDHVLVAEAGR